MSNELATLRHTCNTGGGPPQGIQVVGEVGGDGRTLGWGVSLGPQAPSPHMFAFASCPWCGESLPPTVALWRGGSGGSGKLPLGFTTPTLSGDPA